MVEGKFHCANGPSPLAYNVNSSAASLAFLMNIGGDKEIKWQAR